MHALVAAQQQGHSHRQRPHAGARLTGCQNSHHRNDCCYLTAKSHTPQASCRPLQQHITTATKHALLAPGAPARHALLAPHTHARDLTVPLSSTPASCLTGLGSPHRGAAAPVLLVLLHQTHTPSCRPDKYTRASAVASAHHGFECKREGRCGKGAASPQWAPQNQGAKQIAASDSNRQMTAAATALHLQGCGRIILVYAGQLTQAAAESSQSDKCAHTSNMPQRQKVKPWRTRQIPCPGTAIAGQVVATVALATALAIASGPLKREQPHISTLWRSAT
jgi:hypothetical protein